ncbi:MAG: RNA methyltransferase [Ignavibacteriae bacterium]|nr:RNA methyltransferase [Ignavibacteria bacterium]MBI3364899.1 RNA methyltransferase [Ignavibacteriota bacterium]
MTYSTRATKAKLAGYQKLLQKKYRQLQRRFLIEGVHLVEEALASEWEIEALLVSDGFLLKKEYPDIERKAASRRAAIYGVSDRELEKLSDTITSQGIVGIVHQRSADARDVFGKTSSHSMIVALDGIADPGNLGTIVRTCDWFGADAILLSDDTVELYNPKVVRTTMGSLFHLPILTESDIPGLLSDAKRAGFTIVATALRGESIYTFSPLPDRCIMIFGNEAHGVRPELHELATVRMAIPRFGKAESLNVASAVSVVLSTFRLRQS